MAKIDLSKYGITGTTEIVYNLSYEMVFEEEMKPELEGHEKGQVSELGAVNVMTGIYTGRSPKDKFIVVDENSKDTVWWTSDEYKNDNHPASQETWKAVKDIALKELSNKRLFVVDAFCGANKDTRMAIRFIVEVAWQAHFVKNMFIKPTAEELENFEPDFVVYNASKAKVENYKELGLNSETAVVFNITSREQVIINTWYGGEMKKGMFSMMNYYLPLKGIASMMGVYDLRSMWGSTEEVWFPNFELEGQPYNSSMIVWLFYLYEAKRQAIDKQSNVWAEFILSIFTSEFSGKMKSVVLRIFKVYQFDGRYSL